MTKTLRVFLIFFLASSGWEASISAQSVIAVDSFNFWMAYPEKYMEYLIQPPDTYWSLQDVQALPDSAWRPVGESYGIFLGITTRGHWLRFRLRNNKEDASIYVPKFDEYLHSGTIPLLLECNNPNLDTIAFYRVDEKGNVLTELAGNRFLPERRSLPYPNPVFLWEQPNSTSSTVYLYVHSMYYTANYTFSLWGTQRWQLNFKQVEIGASILFFVVVLVYLFTLTLLFAIVRVPYLWLFYSYVLLTALFFANDLGIWYWVWPRWDYRIWSPALINLSTVCGLLFVRYYFQTQRRYPGFERALLLLSASALATAGLSLLLHQRPVVFTILNKVLIINLLITCGAIMGLVLYSYHTQRNREKIWFIVAFTPHGLGIVLTCLLQLNVLPPHLLGLLRLSEESSPYYVQLNTPWLLLGGVLWEMLIVSVLFVLRIKDYYESTNKVLAERRNALVLGVETERKRVAQDIHDGIGVLLSSTKMKLAVLRDRLKENTELYRETGDLMGNIDLAHEEMRELAYNLMPKSLEKLGLAQAIEGAVSRLRRSQPTVDWHFYSNFQNGHLDELIKINLFRIAQEMLHNVLLHAHATEAHLQLLRQDDRIVLSMEDNGAGFQPKIHTLRTGIGLSNIRYRAEDVLKGKVTIESSPGKGTFVAVEVPV